uniref:Uncharacterized protein n=1 Tax=Magallana gigas TaxID=29159 RepID=K1Q0T9_MAGGI
MEGIGRTVQLFCVGSKVNQTKSVMISSTSNCRSGEVSSTVSLQINPSELQGQYYSKQTETVPEPQRRESWLVVTLIISVTLLVVILVFVTILLILAHRKGGLSLFGFVIKRERDIYQNQHCSPTANGSDNTYEMPLSPTKQPTYEEMKKSDVRKEEYEALSF